jgi:hypothetical protein
MRCLFLRMVDDLLDWPGGKKPDAVRLLGRQMFGSGCRRRSNGAISCRVGRCVVVLLCVCVCVCV